MHILCIYPTPPLWAGCDTRSIFKQSTAGYHQHHVAPSARISLTLSSPATPLYCPSLLVGLQGYILYVVCHFTSFLDWQSKAKEPTIYS